MSAILDAAVRKVTENRHATNVHPSILKTGRLSVSMLAKNTAEECARLILADAPDDPGQGHWGRNGNALADMNLSGVRYHEGTLEVPLDADGLDSSPYPGVMLAGHFDGLEFFTETGDLYVSPDRSSKYHDLDCPMSADGNPCHGACLPTPTARAVIYENKAPKDDVKEKPERQEEYYWQAAAYLAMLVEMHDAGVRELAPAPWIVEEAKRLGLPAPKPISLPDFLEPAGVVLTIQPYTAPEWEAPFELTRDALAKHLERVRGKAHAVWASVTQNAPEAEAREWDLKNPVKRPQLDVITDEDAEYAMRALFDANERKKQAEADADAAKAILQAHLLSKPGRAGKILGVTTKIQETAPALMHFVKAGSVSVRTWGKIKEPEPIAEEAKA